MQVNIKVLSLSELYSLYQFVSAKAGMMLGWKEEAKKVIRERMEEIEEELYDRAFGLNPFKLDSYKKPVALNSHVVALKENSLEKFDLGDK